MQVDLVTRAGCHLCDEALAELRALGVEPRLRDVDGDPVLFTQFDFRVPVILVEGRVVGEGRLDRAVLARALGLSDVSVARCGPEAAEIVHRLTQAAFAYHSRLAPPRNLDFYRALGYQEASLHAHPGYDEPTWVLLEKHL